MTARIAGIGSYLPDRVMTNHDIEKIVDTSDEWIVTRTGIKERHIAADDQAASDLGAVAARRALENAGVAPEDVDLIVVGTSTPDMFFPNTACLVQNLVGAKNAFCYDLLAACSGFMYGLESVRGLVATGSVKNALVIGVEKLSSVVDWTDRTTCVLFADGAGAAVIQPANGKRGIIASYMKSDGGLGDLLSMPGGGSRNPISERVLKEKLAFVKMNGREVFKNAVRCMTEASEEVLRRAGMTVADVDWIIPHQANIRIIQSIAGRLDTPMDKFFVNLEHVGNISAASLPVALDEAARDNVIKQGDVILLVAFGAGFTWGATVLEW